LDVIDDALGQRITLIHRRLWPALVGVADHLPAERLAAVDEVDTPAGAHRTIEAPLPSGFRPKTLTPPRCSPIDDARALLPACLR